LGQNEADSARFARNLASKKVGNADRSGAFVSTSLTGLRRYAMWLTLFCVVISISLGLALGAMVVGSYEENVRP
jgi:hypothetical protein